MRRLRVPAVFLFLAAIGIEPALAQADNSKALLQVDTTAVPSLDTDGIRSVQRLLREKGQNPGPADGVLGRLTRDAVRNFQEKYGMKATGTIDNQFLFAVGAVSLISSSR